jgi:hypothetical protein
MDEEECYWFGGVEKVRGASSGLLARNSGCFSWKKESEEQ